MINVGTLVTVDLDKARQFRRGHLLEHTGVGIILEMPRIWKRNVKGTGGIDFGSHDPTCWVKIQFGDKQAVIPSDFLDFVED